MPVGGWKQSGVGIVSICIRHLRLYFENLNRLFDLHVTADFEITGASIDDCEIGASAWLLYISPRNKKFSSFCEVDLLLANYYVMLLLPLLLNAGFFFGSILAGIDSICLTQKS
jgi:hypothetical protein